MSTARANPRPRIRNLPMLAIFGLPLAVLVIAGGFYTTAWPKRFATVVEGDMFRSGSVTPRQLETLKQKKGLRSVVCLLNATADETVSERAAAESLGLNWVNISLPGDGSSTPEERERIKAALRDTPTPFLVHCAAGTNRTGLAIGMYRLHQQGWSLDEVMREMRAFGFEDEAHHENLRQALADEARKAATERAAAQPAPTP